MTQRTRSYCFTWNNYFDPFAWTDESVVRTLFGKFKYIVLGFEVGESGTPHIQGYVDFENARTLGGLKRICNAIHWEPRRGTWEEATKYCMKGEQSHDEWVEHKWNGPNFGLNANYIEYGTPNEQGKRTDLEDIKNEIVGGLKVESIVMDNPVIYHQYGRTLNKIEDIALRRNYRTTMTTGFWYWGETGVGKSHIAFEGFTPETHYVFPNDNGWWDGYIQQPTVIFNDFRAEIPYNEMLQLVDKWPYSVRRRNREPMPFTSTKVIVTSSLPPNLLYTKRAKRDAIAQLLRRFTVIHVTAQHTSGGGGNTESPPPPEESPLRGDFNIIDETPRLITPSEFAESLKHIRKYLS